MDGYEDNRRWFLRRLGFTLGGTLTASSLISANIIDTDKDMNISPEQQAFMDEYEKWMDEFIEVIRIQKVDQENYDFARYYMKATERMTLEI